MTEKRNEEVRMTVEQGDINAYARLTDDFNPLHVDPEFAAKTPMGATIAHGTLSISLIWQFLVRRFGPDVLDQIDLDIRFLKPVFAGETLVAGGQASSDDPQLFDVWVKGEDGSVRIAGNVRAPGLLSTNS